MSIDDNVPASQKGDGVDFGMYDDEMNEVEIDIAHGNIELEAGRRIRNNIIRRFFTL